MMPLLSVRPFHGAAAVTRRHWNTGEEASAMLESRPCQTSFQGKLSVSPPNDHAWFHSVSVQGRCLCLVVARKLRRIE